MKQWEGDPSQGAKGKGNSKHRRKKEQEPQRGTGTAVRARPTAASHRQQGRDRRGTHHRPTGAPALTRTADGWGAWDDGWQWGVRCSPRDAGRPWPRGGGRWPGGEVNPANPLGGQFTVGSPGVWGSAGSAAPRRARRGWRAHQ